MTKFLRSSALVTTTLLLTACGGSNSSLSTGNTELNIAATEVIDNTIIPAATRFQQQSQNLVNESQNFCASGNITADNLAALQQQWIDTNLAWYELLPYRFGPLVNSELLPTYTFIDSYRLRGTDYIASVRTKIDSLLAGSDTLNESTFSSLSFQFVGLLALEVSLFEDAVNQSPTPADIVNEYATNPRKCEVLTGYATELTHHADAIQQGWTTNYRDTHKSYRDLIINNQLEAVLEDETGDSAIKKITVSVQEYYDYLANRDITLDAAQLSYSIWLALDNALKNTEELLAGTEATELSLNLIMTNNRYEQTVTDVKNNIKTLRAALTEKNTVDMKSAARTLDGSFKRDIPEALNINLGLNFSDGD